jgi:hypothetical protein
VEEAIRPSRRPSPLPPHRNRPPPRRLSPPHPWADLPGTALVVVVDQALAMAAAG